MADEITSGIDPSVPHEEYERMISKWRKIRIVCAGEEAVKDAAEDFLPRIGKTQADYDSYRNRAMFYAASSRTVKGITGVIFRKTPTVEFPREEFLERVSREGLDFQTFAKRVMRNVLAVGRHGVLVDAAAGVSDATAMPYLAGYRAESILNWRTQMIGNSEVLTLVALKEDVDESSETNPFSTTQSERVRVLHLVPRSVLPEFVPENQPVIESLISFDLTFFDRSELAYAVTVWKMTMREEQRTPHGPKELIVEWVIESVVVPNVRTQSTSASCAASASRARSSGWMGSDVSRWS